MRNSSYAYQLEKAGNEWVFRYDYERHPIGQHPGPHLHVRGTLLTPSVLAPKSPLERVHFPTSRASLESVFRLLIEQFHIELIEQFHIELIEQFHIEPAGPTGIWRAVLAESEALFDEIAYRPLSGQRSERRWHPSTEGLPLSQTDPLPEVLVTPCS